MFSLVLCYLVWQSGKLWQTGSLMREAGTGAALEGRCINANARQFAGVSVHFCRASINTLLYVNVNVTFKGSCFNNWLGTSTMPKRDASGNNRTSRRFGHARDRCHAIFRL
jgi:hypothetical protein